MKRCDILDKVHLEEDDMLNINETNTRLSDQIEEVIDYFERKFGEISELLDIELIGDLDQINEAKNLSDVIGKDLY